MVQFTVSSLGKESDASIRSVVFMHYVQRQMTGSSSLLTSVERWNLYFDFLFNFFFIFFIYLSENWYTQYTVIIMMMK